MECKYIKYTIVEIVPTELKSYNTPLFTIVNSIFLWFYLFIYYIFFFIKSIYLNFSNILVLFKNKYSQVNSHNEENSSFDIPDYERKLLSFTEDIEFVESYSEVFKGKTAKLMLDILRKDTDVLKGNLDKFNFKRMGSFILRKELITVNLSGEIKNCEIENKVILTRSFSKPVAAYLKFMLQKIF